MREKGGFHHDGRFPTYRAVVDHYDNHLRLGLTEAEKNDPIEYLKSLRATPDRGDVPMRPASKGSVLLASSIPMREVFALAVVLIVSGLAPGRR